MLLEVDQKIINLAKEIKVLLIDADGVLTNGKIIYDTYGDEIKIFDVKDGMGIALLKRMGIKTFVITANKSAAVKKRAKELRIEKVYERAKDKKEVFYKILKKNKIKPEQTCYIADDLVDIPVLRRAGLPIAVADAVEEVKKEASYISKNKGGDGAVREICELILKSQGKWSEATERFFT